MARSKTWREIAAPIIHACLKANEGKTDKEIRAAIIDAYPFGERKYHPYKVWCDEVRRQRGKKIKKARTDLITQQELFI